MKKWVLRITVLATLLAGTSMAQDITGTWQGKLAVPQVPNGELRVVFKITKADGGGLKAMLYSIDQPGPGIAASAVTLQGSSVKITIPGIGALMKANWIPTRLP
jgi:hypothetical protein